MYHCRMAKTSFLFVLCFVMALAGHAQNLLSPLWQLSHNGKSDSVNLLLSWERQGFSWMTGNSKLSNDFAVPGTQAGYTLTVGLQCDVTAIYINGQRIDTVASNVAKQRNNATFDIPSSCLQIKMKNKIEIEAANFYYTGGKSNNTCSIQAKDGPTTSSVALDFMRSGHLFSTPDKAIPLIATIRSPAKGSLRLIVRNDYGDTMAAMKRSVRSADTSVTFNLATYKLQPGFYECIALLENGSYVGNVTWMALSPEQITCNNPAPADFDAYWAKALSDLKAVPPGFSIHKVDSLCSATRDGYVAEMQSVEDITIRGYYFVPKGKGKYPAVLHVPGYGYGFGHRDGFKNRKEDVIELALCVRGHGISTDKFNPWKEMTLWAYKACDKDEHVYRSIFLDCVRAVEFLLSRPEVDTTRIGVDGGSQGGGLALATAALCNNSISACAFFDPFVCDTRHQLLIRKVVKDELTSYTKYYPGCTYDKILEVQDYVDTKNFAGRIKCPVMFSTALFDDDCPSHMGFAAYNRIRSEKSYRIHPNDSHIAESHEYDELFSFLWEQFNKR